MSTTLSFFIIDIGLEINNAAGFGWLAGWQRRLSARFYFRVPPAVIAPVSSFGGGRARKKGGTLRYDRSVPPMNRVIHVSNFNFFE